MQKIINLLLISVVTLISTVTFATTKKSQHPSHAYSIETLCKYTQDKPNHISKHCIVFVKDHKGRLLGRRKLHESHPGFLKELVLSDINQNVSTFSWATDHIAASCPDCYADSWGGDK